MICVHEMYTKAFVDFAVERWQNLKDADGVTLRMWFYYMDDEEYNKYVIEGYTC